MIAIRDAIDGAAWLEVCGTVPGNLFRDPFDLAFRIRIKNFEKIDLLALGETDGHQDWQTEFRTRIGLDANVWKLDIDLVNMEKTEIGSWAVQQILCLEDAQGYKFPVCTDSFINLGSPYARPSGLSNFHVGDFPPKIKKFGSFSFELPEFFDDLYISAKTGIVKAI